MAFHVDEDFVNNIVERGAWKQVNLDENVIKGYGGKAAVTSNQNAIKGIKDLGDALKMKMKSKKNEGMYGNPPKGGKASRGGVAVTSNQNAIKGIKDLGDALKMKMKSKKNEEDQLAEEAIIFEQIVEEADGIELHYEDIVEYINDVHEMLDEELSIFEGNEIDEEPLNEDDLIFLIEELGDVEAFSDTLEDIQIDEDGMQEGFGSWLGTKVAGAKEKVRGVIKTHREKRELKGAEKVGRARGAATVVRNRASGTHAQTTGGDKVAARGSGRFAGKSHAQKRLGKLQKDVKSATASHEKREKQLTGAEDKLSAAKLGTKVAKGKHDFESRLTTNRKGKKVKMSMRAKLRQRRQAGQLPMSGLKKGSKDARKYTGVKKTAKPAQRGLNVVQQNVANKKEPKEMEAGA